MEALSKAVTTAATETEEIEELMSQALPEAEYDQYALICECGGNTVRTAIENVAKIMEESEERNIYDTIDYRTKEYSSTIEKCIRKGYSPTLEGIKKHIRDIAGIRIITLIRSDVYRIRDAIEAQPGIELIEERDYFKEPKKNGYRSLHLIVSVQVQVPQSKGGTITKSVPVEIQIRTKAMDCWASLEHMIVYKNGSHSEEDEEHFSHVAEYLNNFDIEAEKMAKLDC